ncbi:MAG: AbrB/MazE/SpoVT family DNA-binding domain-containing protein [Methylobacillus sp.]|jgi:hypothetical protein|nr:AbrB/MazE/SpoVT family DNA-binding domain-containing protein [Methylobacillus sp.]
MLVKLTSQSQITLPKTLISGTGVEYFDATLENGKIVLTPLRPHQVQAIRKKLERFGMTDHDVEGAVAWVRL